MRFGGDVKSIILAFLILTVTTGCAQRMNFGPFPSDHKDIVRDYIKKQYFDPYSLRDVKISNVTSGHLGYTQGWVLCLECNAKNRMGGYSGLRRDLLLINDGQVVKTQENSRSCDSDVFTMTPWPEMENTN